MKDWTEHLYADELAWLGSSPAMDRILQRLSYERCGVERMYPAWSADFHARNPQPKPGSPEAKRLLAWVLERIEEQRAKAPPNPCEGLGHDEHDWQPATRYAHNEPYYECSRCFCSSAAHQFQVPAPENAVGEEGAVTLPPLPGVP